MFPMVIAGRLFTAEPLGKVLLENIISQLPYGAIGLGYWFKSQHSEN